VEAVVNVRSTEEEALILQILRVMRAIAIGKSFEDSVVVGNFGEKDRVGKISSAGSQMASSVEFAPDEHASIRAAFDRFHSKPPSSSVSECCHRLAEDLLNAA
jgi:hypothetical protein